MFKRLSAGSCRAASAALFFLAALPLAAAVAPGQATGSAAMRMSDARVNLKQSYANATKARPGAAEAGLVRAQNEADGITAAVGTHKLTMPGLQVKLSPYTGGPEVVRNGNGTLSQISSANDESIVHAYLQGNADIYGFSAADLSDLVTLGDSQGGSSGLRMLRVEQQIGGMPVFQSETRFLIDRFGRVVSSLGRMVPNARASAPEINANALSAQVAVVKLLALDGQTVDPASLTVATTDHGRITLAENDSYIKGPIAARAVLFPLAPGMLVQAWSLVVFTGGDADWYAIVDAQTGDLLWRKNIRAYASAHDARFRVYVQADGVTPADSPAPQSPSAAAPGSGTQFPSIAPTIVSMHTAMSATASPNGWINDCPGGVCTANETQTLGNNVIACMDQVQTGGNTDICDSAAATVLDGNGRPTGNPDANSRNRDFLGTTPRDFQTNYLPPPQAGNPEAGQTATGNGSNGTAAIDQFRRGIITNLFYVSNWYHDQLYALGFDEGAGNFQQINFSGFGLGGDAVNADADDGSGTNNSNFATPPDGTGGRMQMYRFTGPTIDRDGSLDSEIMMHELTHGTSNRLVGNAAGLNWDPSAGMGEGWSDFYALSLLNNTNADAPMGRYAVGAYATYKLAAGYFDNYVYGIRRFPVCADKTVNPLTWGDVDDVTNNLSGGIAADPLGFNINGALELHNIGEVWANTLWDVRARVIADPAGANGDVPTGNHTMLQLVTDALKMTPIDPSFTDARDAVLNADCATHACANEGSIWAGFANRGLGYKALTPYNIVFGFAAAHMGVRESFLSPYLDVVNAATDVTIDDSADNNNGAIDPGEAIKITVKLTNPWRAASKAVASATATLTTSTPGVTIYDNSSTYGAIAPLGSATGDSFMFTVAPTVVGGSPIDFTLTTVSTLGTTSTTFQLRIGKANGTDPVVTYTGTPSPALTVTNDRPRGVTNQINITDDFVIADVDFRVDSITTTRAGDITAELHSPANVGTDFISIIDGLNDVGGANITNMVVDDEIAATAANDMVEATSAAAPYTKSWTPVFNSPWPALAGFPTGPDPVGNLSRFDGSSTKGTWTTLVSDQGTSTGGATFNGWSMLVRPVHFDVTPFAAAVALTATKTVSGTFHVGNTVTYTITITNNGTANQADNAGNEFTDTLPAGLTLVGATATSGTAATSGNTVTWNGSLAPLGGSTTITITATINSGQQSSTISNQGTVSYDSNADDTNDATLLTDDPGVVGSSDPTSFLVAGAQVSASKAVSGTFSTGGTVTYTIVLTNNGSATAPDDPGSELTDVLPSSLTLVSASATSGAAVATVGTNTVTWDGSIPASGSVTVTITATINSGHIGETISNQGSIAYDSDLDGTHDVTGMTNVLPGGGPTTFVVTGAAVSASKSVAGTFTVGGTVTYTIVLANSGPSATPDNAGNEFTDVLPSDLTIVSANATSGTAVATVGTNTATWNGSIPAAGSVTITVTATINSGTIGHTITNQGSLSYDADLNGSNETTIQTDDPSVAGANNATSFVVTGATVTATKTVSGTFVPGHTVTYTVVLANSGNASTLDNTGNEFTDVLPSDLTIVSANATSGTAVATVGTNTATWNGSVPAAGSVTVTITATINNGTIGHTISNQGLVSYDSDSNGVNETTIQTDDPSVAGSSNPTSFLVTGASLTATKSASGTFVVGSTVTYTIVISNSGNAATADDAGNELTDVLPSTLTLLSANATSGTAVATIGTNTVTWNGGVPAGGSVTVTIMATINSNAAGQTITNQATISYDSDGNGTNDATTTTDDPSAGGTNDPTSFTAVAIGNAALTATKSVSGTFTTGSVVTYTIVISNSGSAASLDNAGHELTDTLPAALSLVSANATGGTAATSGNTVTWDGSVPAGGSVTVTITATINSGFQGTTVSNQATLSYDADLNGTNESTAVSDNPATVAANDPTTFAVVSSTDVPTLSTWALLLMALALGFVAIRTRLS